MYQPTSSHKMSMSNGDITIHYLGTKQASSSGTQMSTVKESGMTQLNDVLTIAEEEIVQAEEAIGVTKKVTLRQFLAESLWNLLLRPSGS